MSEGLAVLKGYASSVYDTVVSKDWFTKENLWLAAPLVGPALHVAQTVTSNFKEGTLGFVGAYFSKALFGDEASAPKIKREYTALNDKNFDRMTNFYVVSTVSGFVLSFFTWLPLLGGLLGASLLLSNLCSVAALSFDVWVYSKNVEARENAPSNHRGIDAAARKPKHKKEEAVDLD